MIDHSDILARVDEWDLREDVVEKDYVLGWMLWGIGVHTRLHSEWVFKGGTCLKKCFFETFRFSEDLDFTVTEGNSITAEEVQSSLAEVLAQVSTESGIDFSIREPNVRVRPNGSLQGRIYYRGPRQAPTPASIRIDLTMDEIIVRPPISRPIRHLYPDQLPEPGTIRCYSLEEVFAEKLRAMEERGRPRDLYDIILLFGNPDLRDSSDLVHQLLHEKCQNKGVPIPSLDSLLASPTRGELESEWENMLAHQLPVLAPLEHYWNQLADLFNWLTGTLTPVEQAPAPGTDQVTWEPSPSQWAWESGPSLEPIRFAGANRLCVDLGYQGSVRRIEPYSLRTTGKGNLLLHAVRVDNQQHRAYRVDRIQSVNVTTQPFTSVYLVEFTTSGSINAPTQHRRRRDWSRSSRVAKDFPYRVKCPYCGKTFRRKRPSTRLNRHKTPDGYPCSGRSGYLI